MAQTRVVILSGQSLFAQGIASRLEQYLESAELEIVSPRQSDVLAKIAAARPSVVILDASDAEVAQLCSLNQLLLAFSKLKVICLGPQQKHIHVVTSEQHAAGSVRELAQVLDQSI